MGPQNCFVSEVTIAELYYGASKSERKKERLKDVDFIVDRFEILPIFPALQLFGDLKVALEKPGTRIDDFDILIGATSIVNHMVMVSDNVKHLGRIPDIQLENRTQRQ